MVIETESKVPSFLKMCPSPCYYWGNRWLRNIQASQTTKVQVSMREHQWMKICLKFDWKCVGIHIQYKCVIIFIMSCTFSMCRNFTLCCNITLCYNFTFCCNFTLCCNFTWSFPISLSSSSSSLLLLLLLSGQLNMCSVSQMHFWRDCKIFKCDWNFAEKTGLDCTQDCYKDWSLYWVFVDLIVK